MLDVQNLTKLFSVRGSQPVKAVDEINFSVKQGEFFTLLGPSGCGKTTTLRCVAGLERPYSGKISLRGKTVFDSTSQTFVDPNHRNIGMVFQSYAIWPHLNVFDNVAFPLRAGGQRNSTIIDKKVAWALELVGLNGFAERPAPQLSGGQQQRVALARALVKEPDLLLLDEPLSNLDSKLRERMRSELKRLQRELGITTLYVTHDQIESMHMSDRVAVMSGGRILQMDRPNEVYERPTSQFVADFMGSTNLINGVLRISVSGPVAELVDTDLGPLRCSFASPFAAGTKVVYFGAARKYKNRRLKRFLTTTMSWKARIKDQSVCLGVADYSIDVRGIELRVRSAVNGRTFSDSETVKLQVTPDKCVVVSTDKGDQRYETAATD